MNMINCVKSTSFNLGVCGEKAWIVPSPTAFTLMIMDTFFNTKQKCMIAKIVSLFIRCKMLRCKLKYIKTKKLECMSQGVCIPER